MSISWRTEKCENNMTTNQTTSKPAYQPRTPPCQQPTNPRTEKQMSDTRHIFIMWSTQPITHELSSLQNSISVTKNRTQALKRTAVLDCFICACKANRLPAVLKTFAIKTRLASPAAAEREKQGLIGSHFIMCDNLPANISEFESFCVKVKVCVFDWKSANMTDIWRSMSVPACQHNVLFRECPWDRKRLCSLKSGLPVWPSSYELECEASGCEFFHSFDSQLVQQLAANLLCLCKDVCLSVCVCVFVCVSTGLRWDSQREIDGAMHVERRTQLLCMLYESVTPSLLLALPLAPPPRHQSLLLFYGRKEGEAWQVSAVKARDELCVCVSHPSLKRRKDPAWRLMSAQQEELRLLGWGVRFSRGFVFSGLEFKPQCHPSASSWIQISAISQRFTPSYCMSWNYQDGGTPTSPTQWLLSCEHPLGCCVNCGICFVFN